MEEYVPGLEKFILEAGAIVLVLLTLARFVVHDLRTLIDEWHRRR
jgi:hypothetical protein